MSDAKETSADKAFDLKVDKDESSGYEYVIYSRNRSIKAVGITDGHFTVLASNFTRKSCIGFVSFGCRAQKNWKKTKNKLQTIQTSARIVQYVNVCETLIRTSGEAKKEKTHTHTHMTRTCPSLFWRQLWSLTFDPDWLTDRVMCEQGGRPCALLVKRLGSLLPPHPTHTYTHAHWVTPFPLYKGEYRTNT